MIDVDIELTVCDRSRRFDLAARFSTDVGFAALYGPSGSGKTLTVQAIAGLLRPQRGRIRLDGRTLYDSEQGVDVPAAARRIGYLFQHYALFPHLTVRQNIQFGLTSWRHRQLSSADREHIETLLDMFDLRPMADSRPASLSGGQQQRVALARALACRPQVLLLDEPFAALNPMLRHALRAELAQVRSQWAIPALMITHDIDDVIELADMVFVYQQGQVEREVDLRTAQSRTLARQAIDPHAALDSSPRRERLRRLLLGGS